MANQEMIKRAYAEGAYAALKEAGYDDQTATNVAWEMAKNAAPGQGPFQVPAAPDLPGTIQGLLGGQKAGPSPRQQAILNAGRGPKGLVPPSPAAMAKIPK